VQGLAGRDSASLDPDDPESPHFHEEEGEFHAGTQGAAETRRGFMQESAL
jgi:hypothetical protein